MILCLISDLFTYLSRKDCIFPYKSSSSRKRTNFSWTAEVCCKSFKRKCLYNSLGKLISCNLRVTRRTKKYVIKFLNKLSISFGQISTRRNIISSSSIRPFVNFLNLKLVTITIDIFHKKGRGKKHTQRSW